MTGPTGDRSESAQVTGIGNTMRYLRAARPLQVRSGLRGSQILWGCCLIVAISILSVAAAHLGPGIAAARGEGTHGVWVAGQQVCSRGSCQWYGSFQLPDGKVKLPWVTYTGPEPSIRPGWRTPALDAGAGDEVYPPHGSSRWIHDVIGVAVAAAVIAILLWLAVRTRLRRRRGRLHPVGIG